MTQSKSVPSVSVTYAANGTSKKANELGMRPMQERAYDKRGEQYLLISTTVVYLCVFCSVLWPPQPGVFAAKATSRG